MTFGERLYNARRSVGLTQKELSKLTDIAESSISHFEKDKRQPSIYDIRRLAKALRCTTDYLLGMTDASIRNVNKFS